MGVLNPLALKLIAGFVLLCGLFTAGYFFGWKHEHDALVSFTSATQAIGKAQEAQNLIKEKQYVQDAQQIAGDYTTTINELHRRLQHTSAGRSTVPTTADHSQATDGGATQVNSCLHNDFTEQALKCEAELEALHVIIKKNNFPVR